MKPRFVYEGSEIFLGHADNSGYRYDVYTDNEELLLVMRSIRHNPHLSIDFLRRGIKEGRYIDPVWKRAMQLYDAHFVDISISPNARVPAGG